MEKVLLLMAFVLPFVFISCGDDKDEPVDDHDDHEYVDLGLPSGISLHRPIGPCCACPAELAPLSRWLAMRFIVSI